jgi:hypothetical protein
MGKREKPNKDFQDYLAQQQQWDYQFQPDQALWHSRERQRCVAQLLGWINLFRQNGDLKGGESVGALGARYQQLSGGAVDIPAELSGGPPQGAHVLPALIQIGNRDMGKVPKDWRHQRIMKDLVGTVVVLPAEYNSADLMAEQAGLEQVLVSCCRRMVNESDPSRTPQVDGQYRVDRELVRQIYAQTWVPGAGKVFDELIAAPDSEYTTNWMGRPDRKTAAFMRNILKSYRQALTDKRATCDIYFDFLDRDFNRPDIVAAVAGERGKVFPIFAEPEFSERWFKNL